MGADKELIRKRFEANFSRYDRLALVQREICSELRGLMAELCDTESESLAAESCKVELTTGLNDVESEKLMCNAGLGELTAVSCDAELESLAVVDAEQAGLTPESCEPASILRAMEIGVGTGFLTYHLADMFPQAEWYLNDISDAAQTFVAANAPERTTFICGDAENIEFPRQLDLIASASTVQWFDNLPGFAARAAAATNQGGWLVLSTFGPDNFCEIRNTTGEGLVYYTLEELRDIFEGVGYEIRTLTQYTRSLRFETPLDVLHHIKATGVNSLGKTRWDRHQFTRFNEKYRAAYGTDAGVVLTYHPILLMARKL